MTDATVKLSDAAIRRRMLAEFWFYFSQNRGAVLGLVVFILLVLIAVFAGLLAPHDPTVQYRDALLVPPMWEEGANGRSSAGLRPHMQWAQTPLTRPQTVSVLLILLGL